MLKWSVIFVINAITFLSHAAKKKDRKKSDDEVPKVEGDEEDFQQLITLLKGLLRRAQV